MLTFLAPLALLGIGLLSIPIIVHIFKPRRVRQTPFSSLRWLRMSEQRLSRRIKWHQILLFLIRAAFITFLVLALAHPMFSPSGASALAERFVVLDVSRSMGYQAKGRSTPLQVGKEVAERLIRGGVAGDRTAVLLTAAGTKALGPLSSDANVYIPPMAAAKALPTDCDLGSSLAVIRAMLAERRAKAEVDIYLVTDNHQQSWTQGEVSSFLKGLDVPLNVTVVDVGAGSPQNAWIASARLSETRNPTRRFVRAQVACIGDAGQERTLHLTGLAGQTELTRNLRLDPGQPAQVDLEIPPNIDLTGKVAHLVLDPPDALPSDDDYFLNLDTRGATHVLIVEGDSTQPEPLRPAFHLRTALDALALDSNGALDLVSKTASNLASTDIKSADVIFMADVTQMSDINLAALQDRVKAGAGVAIFLGPDVSTTFYNSKLYDADHTDQNILPLPIQPAIDADRHHGGLAALDDIRWTHPLLAPLFDPVMGDLALTRARTFSSLQPPPAAIATGNQTAAEANATIQVLAWLDEKTPAIVEHMCGAGKVLLFNTTANDAWSDLPRRKSFVPLIDRVLAHLTGGGMRRTFESGQTVAIAMPTLLPQEKVTVTSPTGAILDPKPQNVSGRTILRLEDATDVGVYQVHREGGNAQDFQFVVQAGRGDSALIPMDNTTLQGWWSPSKFRIIAAGDSSQRLDASGSRWALWPMLIFLACAAFLAEMYLVHYLCPRVSPGVIAPQTRQSMMAPSPNRPAAGSPGASGGTGGTGPSAAAVAQ